MAGSDSSRAHAPSYSSCRRSDASPSLLTLSDVMGTGHHAARTADMRAGHSVAVVGDGAVGLWGVIAARRLGAERIIVLGRHADRLALAEEFGATDFVSERGDEAIARVRELTTGNRRPLVLECVSQALPEAAQAEAAMQEKNARVPGERSRILA